MKFEKDLFDDQDINLDLDKEFDKIFDSFQSGENDGEDPFDDNLPEPGTPLYNVMVGNGILHTEQRKIYAEYDPSNIGCSRANPIVINETDDYVHLEYELLEYILRPSPYRFVDYEVLRQALMFDDNGKSIDRLTVELSKHPLLSFEELSSGVTPQKEVLGTEDYYFDITAGYNALSNSLD